MEAVQADGKQAKTTTFNDMWEFNLADDTPDRAPWKRVLPAGENKASRTRTASESWPGRRSLAACWVRYGYTGYILT